MEQYEQPELCIVIFSPPWTVAICKKGQQQCCQAWHEHRLTNGFLEIPRAESRFAVGTVTMQYQQLLRTQESPIFKIKDQGRSHNTRNENRRNDAADTLRRINKALWILRSQLLGMVISNIDEICYPRAVGHAIQESRIHTIEWHAFEGHTEPAALVHTLRPPLAAELGLGDHLYTKKRKKRSPWPPDRKTTMAPFIASTTHTYCCSTTTTDITSPRPKHEYNNERYVKSQRAVYTSILDAQFGA